MKKRKRRKEEEEEKKISQKRSAEQATASYHRCCRCRFGGEHCDLMLASQKRGHTSPFHFSFLSFSFLGFMLLSSYRILVATTFWVLSAQSH